MITILEKAIGEITEKKSRFIAEIRHVESQEEAVKMIEEIRTKHYNAKHHVYGYIIGENGNIRHSSDDGEPSGTGGKPILDVLEKQGLSNVCIVVTRYFGGILLGTGGLARAYSSAAALSVKNTSFVKSIEKKILVLDVPVSLSGKIQNELFKRSFTILSMEYLSEIVIFNLAILPEEYDFLRNDLSVQYKNHINITDTQQIKTDYQPIN